MRRMLLTLVLMAGCASSGGPTPRGNPDVLTQSEIESVHASSLYEVVERLRPRWLQGRGTRNPVIAVYQGQQFMGHANALRQYGPDAASGMRYLTSQRARQLLMRTNHGPVDGVIIVDVRQQD